MVDIFLITTLVEVILSIVILLFALLYPIPLLLVRRFRHHNNIFIINICLTTLASGIFFLIYFAMYYFDFDRLFAPNMCIVLYYGYNIAGVGIPFAFVNFTIYRFCSIMYPAKGLFKTKRWIVISITIQWISEFVISMPFIFRQEPYCTFEIWMQIYTCLTAVFVPLFINMVLYVLIFLHARSSSRRVHAQTLSMTTSNNVNIQQGSISRRDISLLRQMFFIFSMFIGGWAPAYLSLLISNYIYVDPIIPEIMTIIAELCILSITINLFICNHELRQYLKNKIRQIFHGQ
ncbi:unnamed protein product [Adineta steineri]|uniref:G-protein coupled receptors family 1 profile domain-containing protein n=2 Tax=Adineta steineri TaxID=433720 RepID=A0A819BR65_9BILA|nr:unnamed protein product [Adineta steineri]CAF3798734.1 unnamed protein product [Adineta steineri]CAF4021550.1 unnamed protein product [Adineta steineri]